ncbi:response regulator [Leptobacterium flavescens]|uniref:Response regulator n=1 Tax=Leptobacterium flavescens TaxID=472055 RepID=A0A6P0UMT0_9FLAO|nr:sigma-54 dependent transcriptional regulator [Leptobacterium flavescens]NER14564.1 response regulator [Leptobacterium flavescens]
MPKILLIEDDVAFSKMLASFLTKKGYLVSTDFNARNISRTIKETGFDLVLTDMRLPEKDGIAVLDEIKAVDRQLPVVLMTGYADVPTAVKAMKKGAFDYISKPFRQDEVLSIISRALEQKSKLRAEEKLPAKKLPETFVPGTSAESLKLHEHIQLVAPTDMSVLIRGESGTGKEVVAKTIHMLSNRSDRNFVAVDCGAIPKEIAASEFFGHLKGAFTGAIDNKTGSFVAADRGTIFLDEVGNLSYEIQVQLLRALQERKIKPIGSNETIDVDVRVLAATNENLEEAVEKGHFREDLFHRLNEFSVIVPGLCDRRQDIGIFADHFLRSANASLGRNIKGFSPEVLQLFNEYRWPGNLRELQNVIKRSVLLSRGEQITKEVLPPVLFEKGKKVIKELFNEEEERRLIVETLKQTGNNKSRAAQLLNIDRKTLYNKLKKYDLIS